MNVIALKRASAEPRIVATLIAVSKQTRAILGIRLADIGLAIGEDDVTMVMSDGKPICVAEISRKLAIRQETVSRLVEQLLAHGHVERAEGPLYRLSEDGFGLVEKIVTLRMRMADDIEALLGTDAVGILTEYLETLETGLGRALRPTI